MSGLPPDPVDAAGVASWGSTVVGVEVPEVPDLGAFDFGTVVVVVAAALAFGAGIFSTRIEDG